MKVTLENWSGRLYKCNIIPTTAIKINYKELYANKLDLPHMVKRDQRKTDEVRALETNQKQSKKICSQKFWLAY